MTLLFDARRNRDVAGSSDLYTHTIATGANLLIVAVNARDFGAGSPTITSVTWDGIALTSIVSALDSSLVERVALYYLLNPTAGTLNVSITCSAATDEVHSTASSWFGADPVNPIRGSNSATD